MRPSYNSRDTRCLIAIASSLLISFTAVLANAEPSPESGEIVVNQTEFTYVDGGTTRIEFGVVDEAGIRVKNDTDTRIGWKSEYTLTTRTVPPRSSMSWSCDPAAGADFVTVLFDDEADTQHYISVECGDSVRITETVD